MFLSILFMFIQPHAVPKVVRQFQFHRWAPESPLPSSKLALFELIDMVGTSQKQTDNKPIVVHCMYVLKYSKSIHVPDTNV